MPETWINASNEHGAGIEAAGKRLDANPIMGAIVGRVAHQGMMRRQLCRQ
jgi:hypothetical protein